MNNQQIILRFIDNSIKPLTNAIMLRCYWSYWFL